MLNLMDIGLNLTHESFAADREEVIAQAERVGVRRFLITGTSVASSVQALELAHRWPFKLYSTAGIHPHCASGFDQHSIDALRDLLTSGAVVAVGECGLDFFRNFSPREAQELAFRAQLTLAAESGVPVFLHQRDAHETFVRMLQPLRKDLCGGVAHCFTGGVAELEAYLELGLHIGITGWLCDERRGAALREALPRIPLDRLLLETDAPYLLPRDLQDPPRNRRNEPRYLPHILERTAELCGRSVEDVAAATTANAELLFRLPQLASPS
jgi:TatD DNase family protein